MMQKLLYHLLLKVNKVMGVFGVAINGMKGLTGLLTGNDELLDSALENGQKSLRSFIYDPVGVTDVIDEFTNT